MASLQGWAEVALFSLLFVLMFTAMAVEMNIKYDKSNDGSFGLVTNKTLTEYTDYQSTLQSSIKSGEAETNTLTGISLTTTWSMVKAGIDVVWSFITGGWIEQIGGMAQLPTYVTFIFRILFILSVGFIAIKLLLKVRA